MWSKLKQLSAISMLSLMALFILLGRAYQFLFWDSPFRTFLWDEQWMKPLIESFGGNWKTYVTSSTTDIVIDWISIGLAILFLLTVILLLIFLIKKGHFKNSKSLQRALISCTTIIVGIALLSTKEHFYFPVQFFEYTVQFGVLFLCAYLLKNTTLSPPIFKWATVFLSLTFIAHGFYALDIYPRPYHFYEMTMNCLHLTQSQSATFLNFAGIADFVVGIFAFFIFFENAFLRKIGRIALFYMLIWGLLTAFARIVGYWQWEAVTDSLHQWAFQTVYRLPHGLLALWVLLFLKSNALEISPNN